MRNKILLFIAYFLLSAFINVEKGTELVAIMAKLSKANSQKESVSYELAYNLYTGNTYNILKSSLKGNLVQKNGNKYCKLGEIESLQTEKYLVAVDNEEKIIMLSESKGAVNNLITMGQIENYSQLCEKHVLKKLNEKESKLTLNLKAGEVSSVEILFQNNTYAIKKIGMYYPANNSSELYETSQKMEIIFVEKAITQSHDIKLNLASYCLYKNGKWVLNTSYLGYQFINNLQSK